MAKKILILYSLTGGGHLRAAEAIADAIKKQDPESEIVLYDGLEQNNLTLKAHPDKTYGLLSTYFPAFYNVLYTLTNSRSTNRLMRLYTSLIWSMQIKKFIEKVQPDLIVSTHPALSPLVIFLGKSPIPFITTVTDLGKPHRLWFDKKSDTIIVPTSEMVTHAKKMLGSTDVPVKELGYPLKDNLLTVDEKKEFSNTILVTGGGAGSGKMKQQIKELVKSFPDKKIIAVCGSNILLKRQLEKSPADNLEVLGFTDNMQDLIRQADIIISKAGPGTIMEAAMMKRPLIVTEWVGLQEKGNIDFVLKNKLGLYCPKPKQLKKAVTKIYRDYPKYVNSDINYKNGAKNIAEFLLNQDIKLIK